MIGPERDVRGTSAGHPEAAHFAVIDDDAPGEIEHEAEKRVGPFEVVIDTEDRAPITPTIEAASAPPPEPPSRRRRRVGIYAVGSLAALAAVYWAVTIGEWVGDQFHHHSVLGYAILPFVIAALIFSVWWVWGEISAWRRLVIADELRADLSDTDQSQANRERFLAALRRLEATMEKRRGDEISAFLNTKVGNRGADELRVIFDHEVVNPMDAAALTAVHRAVYDSFFLGLVSPTPITDTTAFVIRAIGMIRAVAAAYGHRPGKLGLYRLIRRILADIAILSGVMILMGRASSVVGNSIKGVTRATSTVLAPFEPFTGALVGLVGEVTGDAVDAIGKEIADAITAATRMAQMGLLAIAVSRPVELSAERKAEISSRLREMVFTLRRTGRQGRGSEAAAAAS